MLVDFRLMQGEEDLHVFLGCHADSAAWLMNCEDEALFVRHLIPKKGGKRGEREVWEVRNDGLADLYKGLARKLDQFFRETLSGFPHESAHGYITSRSTFTNAKAHVGAATILKADIKSYFKSIRRTKVVTLLTRLGVKERAAAALSTLVVRENHVPLGLHTSPLLANAVCHELDGRLAALAPGGRYTRYADDISFSGPNLPSRAAVEAELSADGFQLADEKWRVVRAGRGLYVTGLSVEDGVRPRVPKEMKRRLRQDLHHASTKGLDYHLGRRGYGSIQSGINKIDGLIRYIRGVEPTLGLSYHASWAEILRKSGHRVSYSEQGPVAARKVLFIVDESVVERPGGPVMMVALVVIEDVDHVRGCLDDFLRALINDPFGATGKDDLARKGVHWNDLAQDDRTKATNLVRSLPFRCFVSFAPLLAQDKKTYDDTYRRLLMKVVEGRLVRYDRCTIEVVIEENQKIAQAKVSVAINQACDALGKANSRRPAALPTIRVAKKLSEGALPLPDIVMGILGEFACSNLKAAGEAGQKKKRRSGGQADNRFEQIRDKVRAVFDLDSGRVFSRRNPFRPW
jgi:hypothetical protein